MARRVKDYVRTKDGIYKVLWEDDDKSCAGKGMGSVEQIFYETIIRQSDDLEDLIDKWVLLKQGQLPESFDNPFYKLNELTTYAEKNGKTLLGAIWTPWGLKYTTIFNGNALKIIEDGIIVEDAFVSWRELLKWPRKN